MNVEKQNKLIAAYMCGRDVEYNKSWDLLIPVIAKLNDELNIEIHIVTDISTTYDSVLYALADVEALNNRVLKVDQVWNLKAGMESQYRLSTLTITNVSPDGLTFSAKEQSHSSFFWCLDVYELNA